MIRAKSEYGYVAYIDEAGDDGLTRVRPIDEGGSSEWLIVSAFVIRATRENEVKEWLDEIRNSLWRYNAPALHFRKLNEAKKLHVCQKMANLKARFFVVCSNKKNMRGYKNPLAEKIPSQNWFYCWMTRLLLERVTDFVYWHSKDKGVEPQKLKIEYSNRGGLSYSQMDAYYRWISYQGENTFLRSGRIHWSVIDHNLLQVYPHYERAGLGFADILASSFFKACDVYNTRSCDPRFARELCPRIARFRDKAGNSQSGYGVKLLPTFKKAKLLSDQEEIFRYYGYPQEWWAPDPSDQ